MLTTNLTGCRSRRRLTAITAVFACALLFAANARGGLIWERGHGDIGLAYEGGALELHYHLHAGAKFEGQSALTGDAEYGPSEMYVRVRDPAVAKPGGPQWDFLGPGSSLWFLPHSSDATKPFVGIASEELDPSDWLGSITWALTSFSGPAGGNFSLWQTDLFGNPDLKWSTWDSIADVFTAGVGGHDHYNWGFTAPGVYTLGITASGTHESDGFKSDFANFTFLVGNQTAVPEPSTMVLFAGAAFGALPWWLRRRVAGKKSTPEDVLA